MNFFFPPLICTLRSWYIVSVRVFKICLIVFPILGECELPEHEFGSADAGTVAGQAAILLKSS